MEKTVQTSVQHVESGSQQQARQDGLQPAADDGGTDKPPIPNASSTGKGPVLLNHENPVGARESFHNNKPEHEGHGLPVARDVDNVPDWAHTADFAEIARLLATDVE